MLSKFKYIGLVLIFTAIFGAATHAATLTVTKTADTNDGVCDADCSLREAIAAAQSGDTVQFASPLFDTAQSVQVNGQLVINKNLTITGRGANLTILQNVAATATPMTRVFQIDSGTVNLSNLTVTGGNSAGDNLGGGINNFGTLTITNSIISNNVSGNGGGGGISNSGTLNLTNSTVSNNSAAAGGCIFNRNGGTTTLINSTISGGSAVQGGGINNFSGTVNVINSTVSGNRGSNQGGGIFNPGNTVTITNSTVSGNWSAFAGGIYSFGTVRARNTIISGNTGFGSPNIFGSLSPDDSNIVGNEASVRLAPLGNYGGTTQTHALLAGSSAINAGNNCVLTQTCADFNPPVALTADQRGRSRVGQTDIGAFEAQANLVVTNTLDSGAGSLRNAIQTANSTTDDESITFNIPANDSGCMNSVCTITLTSGELAISSAATAGILFIQNSNGTARNLRISGNNASRVFNISSGANVTMNSLTVTDGRTAISQTNGGGINNAGTLNLTNVEVIGNSVTVNSNGGGIANNGTLTLTNSSVLNNSATNIGGGIAVLSGTINITNSTISGNSIGNSGGGIYIANGVVNLTNSTVTNNSTGGDTGGIRAVGVLNSRNSIFSGNTSRDVVGALNSQGYNLIGNTNDTAINGDTTGNILNQDARLAPLGYYGGETMMHALLSNSPAVNQGNNCVNTANGCGNNNPAIPNDQRGAARVGQTDIGAFELNNSANGGNFRAVLPIGRQAAAYNYTLTPNNGAINYTLTGGALPNGINLTTNVAPSAVVAVGGIPTQTGIFNFSVTASDGVNSNVTDYQLQVLVPTAAGVSIAGRVLTNNGIGLRNAVVILTDQNGNTRSARTSAFGYYHLEDIEAGQTVIISVVSKRFTFIPQIVNVNDNLSELDFTAQ